ncbi:hypothetical protein BDZ85DRAFT_47539 [Elsinoe ampelina]|uniref:Uncharacterized protein n=1 Tax=Elsinoe ampelina TaxID=302913 RepID=A0A6A6GKF3_9PEZI|nr:hypothetical protein BDZ85DRAFT_47539 [Elsinoe ampelina]
MLDPSQMRPTGNVRPTVLLFLQPNTVATPASSERRSSRTMRCCSIRSSGIPGALSLMQRQLERLASSVSRPNDCLDQISRRVVSTNCSSVDHEEKMGAWSADMGQQL